VVVASAAVVVTSADTAVVVASPPVAGVVAELDLLSLPHATATSESEMSPASTSRRLTRFTYVSPWLGMNNAGHRKDRS
jgi:hypothetical protein